MPSCMQLHLLGELRDHDRLMQVACARPTNIHQSISNSRQPAIPGDLQSKRLRSEAYIFENLFLSIMVLGLLLSLT
jgi:hypothetical protein